VITSALLLPLRAEDLPPRLGCFDTVLSMGVLYHAARLRALSASCSMRCVPAASSCWKRWSSRAMRARAGARGPLRDDAHVWFIPARQPCSAGCGARGLSRGAAGRWSRHQTQEQRRTPWMRFESLADFLDPARSRLTREGYPAPLRAVFMRLAPR